MNGRTDPKLKALIQETEDTLLECPFCGMHAEIDNTHTAHYWAECVGCGANIGDGADHFRDAESIDDHRESIKGVAAAWNKRRSNEVD